MNTWPPTFEEIGKRLNPAPQAVETLAERRSGEMAMEVMAVRRNSMWQASRADCAWAFARCATR